MSDIDTETVHIKLETTGSAMLLAGAAIINEFVPRIDSNINLEQVKELKQLMLELAKSKDRDPSSIAVGMIIAEFGHLYGSKHSGPMKLTGNIVELLKSLGFSQAVLEQAVESVSADNYDDTDKELIEQLKALFNLETGVGPRNGVVWDWAKQSFSVAVANAVGFAAQVTTLLAEGGKEQLEKITRILMRAAFAEAPEPLQKMIAEGISLLGSSEAALMLWGLYLGGVTQGCFLGWRSHEITLLEASSKEDTAEAG